MNKLLLDTSIIIDYLRREDKEKTLLYQLAKEDLYISVITHTELYAGKSVWEKEIARKELEDVFSGLTILPLQKDISQEAGRIKSNAKNLSLLDCIIGATALVHDLKLVTLNRKDFEKIKNLNLFTLELKSAN